jgi:hypothetical protein
MDPGKKLETAVKIAAVCHEANRAYCETLGDYSQVEWEDAPDWQRESAALGVERVATDPNTAPSVSHESWFKQKLADGWKYGPEKDPEAKTHPCMVPFSDLPRDQQLKDVLFIAVARALLHGR